jgi:hypothetical protein
MLRLAFAGLILTLCVGTAHAAPVAVSPVGYDAGVRQMLAGAASVANAEVRGAGESIVFSYSAAQPLTVLVFFHEQREQLDIATALRGELPAVQNGEAEFRLTSSPAWRPGEHPYIVYLVSADPAGADVRSATVTGGSSVHLPFIAMSQLFASEPFQPSLYHRLQGYRVFGLPVVPLLAVVVLAAVAVLWWKAPRLVFSVLAVGMLFYGLRFSIDLGRYSAAHVAEWSQRGTYATAGSAFAIADAIHADIADTHATILVCSTGTSYVPTLLAYLLHPLVVITAVDPQVRPAYVVQGERIGASDSTCAGDSVPLREMQSFPDGSVLYRGIAA